MDTKIFLIRHGVTSWHREGKLLGRQDVPLSPEGIAQAERTADGLTGLGIGEVISSPLSRALQTAAIIGGRFGIDVARDPRLIDFEVGRWAGMKLAEISASPEYREFVTNPMSTHIPEGENLEQVKRRAVAAIEQALEDTPSGDGVAVITHAGVIRVLLTHYMGAPPATYHRLRVSPGSISVLSFASDQPPRVLVCNWLPAMGDALAH